MQRVEKSRERLRNIVSRIKGDWTCSKREQEQNVKEEELEKRREREREKEKYLVSGSWMNQLDKLKIFI